MSRLAAFVRAARNLLWMQVGAAVLATGLGVWAIVAVRDLAAERDQLANQVLELQRGQPVGGPATATPAGVAPSPLDTEVRPPAIMPVYVPIVTGPTVTPPIPPVDIPPPADTAPDTPAPANPPSANDCSGPNADPRRCRPNRWTRPDRPVTMQPVPQPVEQPQRGNDPPRID